LDFDGMHMAQTLEAAGVMLIGLAKNGADTWDVALNVDIGCTIVLARSSTTYSIGWPRTILAIEAPGWAHS
jgi:hypothetical protein